MITIEREANANAIVTEKLSAAEIDQLATYIQTFRK